MRIWVDNNQFILGIAGSDPASEALMKLLPYLDVVLPRIVLKEVTRNLNHLQAKALYKLFHFSLSILIIEEPVPVDLARNYIELGLREKGDAIIGAFAEWQWVDYVISENRHFLRELQSKAFEVLSPNEFLQRYYASTIDKEQ